MHLSDEVGNELESELTRTGGATTILIVGERMSGKTTVCERVMRVMGRHVVRWTPYEEFVVGRVSKAVSDLDTLVFVDDADVLVRLAKGSSVSLIEALHHCHQTPGIRIILTSLDTKGRVWRAVAGCVDKILTIPPREHVVVARKNRIERVGWESAQRSCELALASRVMKNWCESREVEEEGDSEIGLTGKARGINGMRLSDTDKEVSEGTTESDGCVVWKVAELLVR